jgi:hypothetical protein
MADFKQGIPPLAAMRAAIRLRGQAVRCKSSRRGGAGFPLPSLMRGESLTILFMENPSFMSLRDAIA